MKIFANDPTMTEQMAKDFVLQCWEPTRHFDEVLFKVTWQMLMYLHAAMVDSFSKEIQSILDSAEKEQS